MSKPSFSFLITMLLISIVIAPLSGQMRNGKFGVGVDGSALYLMGSGETTPSATFGGGLNLSFSTLDYVGIRAKFCYDQLGWQTSGKTTYTSPTTHLTTVWPAAWRKKSITTDMMSLNLYLTANLMPNSNFNVFPLVGAGYAIFDPKKDNGKRDSIATSTDLTISVGGGVDYFINEFWSVTLMGEYVIGGSPAYAGSYALNDKNNDSFVRASIQIRYYFFDQGFITKLLEAQRERAKRGK
jgi:opacity protein-like surface antigen